MAKVWRKRRYRAAFVAKLSDREAAAETQVCLKFKVKCQYLTVEEGRQLYPKASLDSTNNPNDWILK